MDHRPSDDISRNVDALEFVRPSSRAVLTALAAVYGVLLVLDILGRLSGFESATVVSLDGEVTVGTWWASAQLFLVSLLLLLVGRREWLAERRAAFLAVFLGAAATMYFSIDETAGIHELLTRTLGDKNLPSFNSGRGVWMFLYAGAAIVVLAIAIPGVLSLLRTDRGDAIRFAIGGTMLVFGGVVVELSGYYRESHIEVIVEETFEFLGVAVMAWAAYRMLSRVEILIRERSQSKSSSHSS